MRADRPFPDKYLKDLEPLAKELEESIHEGVADNVRRGEASEEINAALLEPEITLSRAVAFIDACASEELAQKLEDDVPRKHVAKKADEPGQGGGANADEDGADTGGTTP